MCVRACECSHGGQRRASGPLELKLQVVVSHLMGVLGTELHSYARVLVFVTIEPLLQSPRYVYLFYLLWSFETVLSLTWLS